MASRSRRQPRLTSRLGLFALAWLALAVAASARADNGVSYFAERRFEIPYESNPDPTFRRLHLHVSTDGGKTYSAAGSAGQLRGAFEYDARADGWYLFVVQLERTDGTMVPSDVRRAEPSQRVCIDTLKPLIKLEQVRFRADTPPAHTVAVQWSIEDKNLDLQTHRLAYRAVGGTTWIPLNATQLAAAYYSWAAPASGTLEVRLSVRDKALNQAEAIVQVRADPSRAAAGAQPPAPNPSVSAVPTGDRPVIYVNRKSFNLTYTLDRQGQSGVKQLEIWRTRDTGQWYKFRTDENPTSPASITVPTTGRYGFTLRPVSGVGRGKTPPRAGDLPQVWVEVDETAPKVVLRGAVVNEGDDPSTITVNWQAQDNFFGDNPITIYYSRTKGPDAKWEVLQANLENTGSHKCKTDGLPFEFYIRVEAVDRAGNKGHDQTNESVKVDLVEPDVKDVNVSVGDPPIKPPGGPN